MRKQASLTKSRTSFSEQDLLTIDERIEQSAATTMAGQIVSRVGPPRQLSHYGGNEHLDPIHQEALRDGEFMGENVDPALLSLIVKGSSNISPSFYEGEDIEIAAKKVADVTDTDAFRRAIHTISNMYNSLGIARDDFDKSLNDMLSRNAYYAIGEKAIQDYFGTAEYTVVDTKDGKKVSKALDFLEVPNPQDSFGDISKSVIRDVVRYDAGAIVKSFNRGGYMREMKAYLGTEFWREQDRVPIIVNVPINGNIDVNDRARFGGEAPMYQGWWSHGYTERFWQRSRTGIYIPFQPEEVSYFMMYPRSDGIYGTDFLKFLKYQLQYLIDSTKAAGKTFENGIVPSVVWEHPDMRSVPQLRQRIKEAQFNNQGWNRFGSVIHTVNGEKVTSLAQSLHDMQWLEGQKFVAQIIWAMWGFSQDEFLGGGSNRATAYVKRNITKSRMLYPIMTYFEDRINRTVLPYLKGYRKSWKFKYLREVELDDEQKMAQIAAVKSSVVTNYISMGMPFKLAMKLAKGGDEPSDDDYEEIQAALKGFNDSMMQPPPGAGGPAPGAEGQGGEQAGMGDTEMGRYGTASGDYQPINFSDYGQGGMNTETRVGEAAEAEFKKADDGTVLRKAVVGRDGQTRELEHHIYYDPKGIRKAKVYIANPGEAPKGRAVRRGNRGGYYYITADAPQAAAHAGGTTSRVHRKKQSHEGWGGVKPTGTMDTESPAGSGGAPSVGGAPPDIQGNSEQIKISGKGVGVVLGIVEGEIQGEALQNEETKKFMNEVMEEAGENPSPEDILSTAIDCAKEQELTIE